MNITPEISIAICQFKVGTNKNENLDKARDFINNSAKHGAQIIVLPECFIGPYDINEFSNIAETINDSTSYNMLKKASEDYKDIYIFGGTIIEKENDKLYNTCFVFKNGELLDFYRKLNLYKIDMEEHSFSEGDVLTRGDKPTIIKTHFGNIGIGICYDLRFPELAKYYRDNNCIMIIYPGSFNRYTGPKHWLVLQQARALDNQLFIVSCSTACSFNSSFESYGKSYIISPWGDVICETELDKEEIKIEKINTNYITDVRKKLPILLDNQ